MRAQPNPLVKLRFYDSVVTPDLIEASERALSETVFC